MNYHAAHRFGTQSQIKREKAWNQHNVEDKRECGGHVLTWHLVHPEPAGKHIGFIRTPAPQLTHTYQNYHKV